MMDAISLSSFKVEIGDGEAVDMGVASKEGKST